MSCTVREETLLKYSVIHAQLELCKAFLQREDEFS